MVVSINQRYPGSVDCGRIRVYTHSQAWQLDFGQTDNDMLVTCPGDNDVAISGGYWTHDGALEDVAIDVSRPWPAEATSPPRSWNVVADNLKTDSTILRVYVVCMSFS